MFDLIILGPRRVGKSMFIALLTETLRGLVNRRLGRFEDVGCSTSEYITRIASYVMKGRPPEKTFERNIGELVLSYRSGVSLFKKNRVVNMALLDVPGEDVMEACEAVSGGTDLNVWIDEYIYHKLTEKSAGAVSQSVVEEYRHAILSLFASPLVVVVISTPALYGQYINKLYEYFGISPFFETEYEKNFAIVFIEDYLKRLGVQNLYDIIPEIESVLEREFDIPDQLKQTRDLIFSLLKVREQLMGTTMRVKVHNREVRVTIEPVRYISVIFSKFDLFVNQLCWFDEPRVIETLRDDNLIGGLLYRFGELIAADMRTVERRYRARASIYPAYIYERVVYVNPSTDQPEAIRASILYFTLRQLYERDLIDRRTFIKIERSIFARGIYDMNIASRTWIERFILDALEVIDKFRNR
ncbi:MAG: hypothetical protein GXO23_03870 [Crenarchaeota archaeon]|nr:hypothetical protein [Thermoproteota archaeon]